MEYREFEPERYPNAFKEGKLFELQTERTDDVVRTKLAKVTSKETYEEAQAVPWFFVVQVE